jgi:hypothetical protein
MFIKYKKRKIMLNTLVSPVIGLTETADTFIEKFKIKKIEVDNTFILNLNYFNTLTYLIKLNQNKINTDVTLNKEINEFVYLSNKYEFDENL